MEQVQHHGHHRCLSLAHPPFTSRCLSSMSRLIRRMSRTSASVSTYTFMCSRLLNSGRDRGGERMLVPKAQSTRASTFSTIYVVWARSAVARPQWSPAPSSLSLPATMSPPLPPNCLHVQHHDTLNNDHVSGADGRAFTGPIVLPKVVHGHTCCLSSLRQRRKGGLGNGRTRRRGCIDAVRGSTADVWYGLSTGGRKIGVPRRGADGQKDPHPCLELFSSATLNPPTSSADHPLPPPS